MTTSRRSFASCARMRILLWCQIRNSYARGQQSRISNIQIASWLAPMTNGRAWSCAKCTGRFSRKRAMAAKVLAACGGSLDGKIIAVLGLTFKPNTDDMREAPSLVIVPTLEAHGARVRAYDPHGMAEARKLMPRLETAADPYACIEGADAMLILT